MPGFAHFELVELIHDDVANTWLAREPGSGRLLLLHKFSHASGLREKIRAMNPTDLGMLIKAGEESGLFYVVTYDTPELRHFRKWVESHSKVKSASIYPPSVNHSDPAKKGLWRPAAAGSPEAGISTNTAGEFTRMFQALGTEPPPPVAQPAPPPVPKEPAAGEFTRMFQTPLGSEAPSPAPQPPEQAPKQPAAGEFTRMFQTPVAETKQRSVLPSDSTPTAEIPAYVEEPATAPEQPAKAGEFTRMFQQPPAAQPGAPAPGRRDEPGEFTRMFNSPGPAKPEATPRPPAPAPASSGSSPGEFTRFFNAPMPATPIAENPGFTAPPEPAPRDPGSFTRMFGRSESPGIPEAAGKGSAATGVFSSRQPPAAPNPAPSAGPGEYTRLFSAPVPPQDVAAPPAPAAASPSTAESMKIEMKAPAPPPAVAAPKNYIGLVVVLAVLAVVAIALILYFALRR